MQTSLAPTVPKVGERLAGCVQQVALGQTVCTAQSHTVVASMCGAPLQLLFHPCTFSSWAAGAIGLTSAIRLVGGSTRFSGRVEMLRNGQWLSLSAPIGDAAGRSYLATTVCRQLGLIDAEANVLDPLAFGMPSTTSWLNLTAWWGRMVGGVSCNIGGDNTLLDCGCSYADRGTWSPSYEKWHSSWCATAMAVNGTADQLLDSQLTVSCPPPTGKRLFLRTDTRSGQERAVASHGFPH